MLAAISEKGCTLKNVQNEERAIANSLRLNRMGNLRSIGACKYQCESCTEFDELSTGRMEKMPGTPTG